MAAVISCISCPSETVKTLTAACCASIYNSFKRLNKMCSRFYIWKCCDVLQIDWWIPPNCSFVFYSCIHQQAHTTVLSSLMEKLYGTICYGNTVCNKLFVFARSDFLPLTTKAEKWNQLWWINHDFIHIKEIFLPTTKLPVRLLKKKSDTPNATKVTLLFQSFFVFSMNDLLEFLPHYLVRLCSAYTHATWC